MGGGKLGLIGVVLALLGLGVLGMQMKDFKKSATEFFDHKEAAEKRLDAMSERVRTGGTAPQAQPAQPASQPQPAAPTKVQVQPAMPASQPDQPVIQPQPQDHQEQPASAQAQPAAQPGQPQQPQQAQLNPEDELKAEFGRFKEKSAKLVTGQQAVKDLLDDLERP